VVNLNAAAPTRAAVEKSLRRGYGRARWLWLAGWLLCSQIASAQPQEPMRTPMLFDHHMTPGAGATVTIAVGRLVARAEDRFVPLKLFEEQGRLRRGANATYRLAKLALFDEPQENWFRVANHEVFGHGGRLRELFDGHIGYQLPAPPPYGRGGGATFFEFNRQPTVEEVLAVTVGGMEANYVAARSLARDALTEGTWHYRDARRYLYAEYDTLRYIRGVHDLEKEGHDVGDFIRIYNDVAADLGETRLTARALRRDALASLANPLIAYSYYSTFVSYVWGGHAYAPVPMIQVGATRYLPMARFHLTSFGTEFVIDNTFVRNGRFFDASVGIGQTIGSRTWSIGLQGTRLASIGGWSIDGEATIWHRPEWGEQFAATVHRNLAERRGRALALVVQAGFKTDGYMPGDRLRQGAIVRVGAALTPTSRQSP
jgi:hypothetical protein